MEGVVTKFLLVICTLFEGIMSALMSLERENLI
jgi:hypothetical protein